MAWGIASVPFWLTGVAFIYAAARAVLKRQHGDLVKTQVTFCLFLAGLVWAIAAYMVQ